MNGIFLLLGSNLNNRLNNLRKAENLLLKHGIQILEESSIYETAPWGNEDQNWFLNLILQVDTSFDPHDLLKCILSIETEIGRTRKEKWGERIIDIDILYYHDRVIQEQKLTIPHPEIPKRKFTLVPLVEMQPLEKHPTLQKTQTELLAACVDRLDCNITDYRL